MPADTPLMYGWIVLKEENIIDKINKIPMIPGE
jgi:hypothetical protein